LHVEVVGGYKARTRKDPSAGTRSVTRLLETCAEATGDVDEVAAAVVGAFDDVHPDTRMSTAARGKSRRPITPPTVRS